MSYILAGIARQPILEASLVFKGGTALRKAYFPEYRFSEDLDFSLIPKNAPEARQITKHLREAIVTANRLVNEFAPVAFALRTKRHRDLHPRGQQEFAVGVRYPWQEREFCKVKLEVTRDEPILCPPVSRQILHDYGEPSPGLIRVYALEEVVAEKLRTLLQTDARQQATPWVTRRGRDYYDLWRLLRDPTLNIDRKVVQGILPQKAAVRSVRYQDMNSFFPTRLIDDARRHWTQALGAFVTDLPPLDQVISELKQEVAAILVMA